MNIQPTIEQKAAYMLNILGHYPFVGEYKVNVPPAYSNKLVEIVLFLKMELNLRGLKVQQSTLEETKKESVEFDFRKVMSQCDEIPSIHEQIDYLEYVIKEFHHF